MFKFLKSITKSGFEGVRQDPGVRKMIKRHPRFFYFLKRRLSPKEKYGLYLTFGTLAFLLFSYLFFKILYGYFNHNTLVEFDLRVMNIVKFFRNFDFSFKMLVVTYLAKWEVIFFGVTLAVSFLFYLGYRYYSLILIISVTLGEFFIWATKNIIERERPDFKNAAISENGFSFPSGHEFMAVSFYGLLAYYFFINLKNRFLKFLIIFFTSLIILVIGFSRIYLGVHWASDVMASLAAGFAWITILITFFKIKREFGDYDEMDPKNKKERSRNLKLGLVLFFAWLLFFGVFVSERIKNTKINLSGSEISDYSGKKTIVSKEDVTEKIFKEFPRVSENIVGKPMEPIHIIIVGSKKELERAFRGSGWYLSDPLNIKNSWKLFIGTIFDRPYPKAPGVPSLWNAIPNDFAFEKPTDKMSVKEREHIHFWYTPFQTVDEKAVWVATAHFDTTIKLKASVFLPTHTIDPAIDNERERIKEDLLRSGAVESIEEFKVVEPTLGVNQSGDMFFTDGRAYLIYLR